MKASVDEIRDIIFNVNKQVEVELMDENKQFSEVGIDSLETFSILLAVEEKYGVTIPEEESENLNTIKAVIDCLDKLDSE